MTVTAREQDGNELALRRVARTVTAITAVAIAAIMVVVIAVIIATIEDRVLTTTKMDTIVMDTVKTVITMVAGLVIREISIIPILENVAINAIVFIPRRNRGLR